MCLNCVTPKAADDMIVNDARGLHPGIDDDRADELEPTLL